MPDIYYIMYICDYYTKLNPTFIILRENFIKIIMFTAIGKGSGNKFSFYLEKPCSYFQRLATKKKCFEKFNVLFP